VTLASTSWPPTPLTFFSPHSMSFETTYSPSSPPSQPPPFCSSSWPPPQKGLLSSPFFRKIATPHRPEPSLTSRRHLPDLKKTLSHSRSPPPLTRHPPHVHPAPIVVFHAYLQIIFSLRTNCHKGHFAPRNRPPRRCGTPFVATNPPMPPFPASSPRPRSR